MRGMEQQCKPLFFNAPDAQQAGTPMSFIEGAQLLVAEHPELRIPLYALGQLNTRIAQDSKAKPLTEEEQRALVFGYFCQETPTRAPERQFAPIFELSQEEFRRAVYDVEVPNALIEQFEKFVRSLKTRAQRSPNPQGLSKKQINAAENQKRAVELLLKNKRLTHQQIADRMGEKRDTIRHLIQKARRAPERT